MIFKISKDLNLAKVGKKLGPPTFNRVLLVTALEGDRVAPSLLLVPLSLAATLCTGGTFQCAQQLLQQLYTVEF